MEILRVENLTKVYGTGENEVRALDGVSFSVEKGAFVAVIGPSGSGKSTLLHILGGVDRPTGGKVLMDGKDVYAQNEEQLAIFRRRQVGLIYQFYNLIPVLNVTENITLPVLMDGQKINQNRLAELMTILKLTGRENHLPNQLSGGQQQRVSIGRALMNAPAVVLADEPTGNLDSRSSREIVELLKVSNEKYGQTLIQKCGVPREELFLTSKIWMSNASYEKAKASIDKSLHKLKTDYLDLMLIHQPFGDYYGAYRAMEEAYKEGKLRAIGVSNFYPDRLIDLCQFAEIAPMVNQVETHVFQQQRTAHEYMKKYGVQHEAWGPFAEGKKNCFTNPVLVEIGEKYGKTAAQTALRFLIQSDVVVIPKSTHKERMEQNLNVFDFSLSEADMEAIRTLDEGKSLFFDHYDPSTVEMLTNMGKTRIV